MKCVFFTIFPGENKSYILLSVLKEDLDVYGKYIEQIKNTPIGMIQYYLNVFIPLYSQNLIISPNLWNNWNEKGQMGVQYTVAEHRNLALLKGLQFYLKNIDKKRLNLNVEKIDSTQVAFNFFKK